MNPLLVRADANAAIGTGHIMRCLALAQAWQDQGGSVTFACAEGLPESLGQRLSAESISVRLLPVNPGSEADARAVIQLAQEVQARVVVVDGYHFGADYQRWLKAADLSLLFIDDNGHAEHYYADWVLNQNIHADDSLYPSREAYTQLLLGTRYALLRREFWRWRGWQREIPAIAHNVLITMGGSDPGNVTLAVLQALMTLPEADSLHVKAVMGGGSPHRAELEAFVARTPRSIELLHNVTDMPALMAWADVAISAGGSTVWELCLLGVPSMIIVTADNQHALTEELVRRQIVVSAQPDRLEADFSSLRSDVDRRRYLSASGQALIDGYGAARVGMAVRGEQIWLRAAMPVDCELIWHWANDPVSRAASFSSDLIPWKQHQAWYNRTLSDAQTLIYVGMNASDEPIGQLRYALADHEAVVSINLAPDQRGKGYGAELLQLGANHLFATTDATDQIAYIKSDNGASRRAFERAGFRLVAETHIKGYAALRFELHRQ